jgi:SAM-dependent methyltransferase
MTRREAVDARAGREKIRTARRTYNDDGVGGLYRELRSRSGRAVVPRHLPDLAPRQFKESHELAFWKGYRATRAVSNAYQQWFTSHFGLTASGYTGKRILDIGCGPLGSLEWADGALERVGLDPLARRYRRLGTSRHKMIYVAAPSEHIPFEDGHFDVVSSFNSLDHVASITKTIRELTRVLRRGGLFLLITELNHQPTPTEPQTFGWDIVDRFQPALELLEKREYERSPDGIYQSIEAANWFDHGNPTDRAAVVSAKFCKA